MELGHHENQNICPDFPIQDYSPRWFFP